MAQGNHRIRRFSPLTLWQKWSCLIDHCMTHFWVTSPTPAANFEGRSLTLEVSSLKFVGNSGTHRRKWSHIFCFNAQHTHTQSHLHWGVLEISRENVMKFYTQFSHLQKYLELFSFFFFIMNEWRKACNKIHSWQDKEVTNLGHSVLQQTYNQYTTLELIRMHKTFYYFPFYNIIATHKTML